MQRDYGQSLPFLRAWRQHRMLSQTQLASDSGVVRATVAHAEAGGRLSYGNIKAIAAALRVSPESLARVDPNQPTRLLDVPPPDAWEYTIQTIQDDPRLSDATKATEIQRLAEQRDRITAERKAAMLRAEHTVDGVETEPHRSHDEPHDDDKIQP